MADAEKPAAMKFELLKAATGDAVAARVGRLLVPGRRAVETPNFFSAASRGVVPHLTPDNIKRHAQIPGAYMALEDFVERRQYINKQGPPIFLTPPSAHGKTLHSFTAMPSPVIIVLGARRIHRVAAGGNGPNSISIFTSTGVQTLTTQEYEEAVVNLSPDIAIPLSDLTEMAKTPTTKRAMRMVERTEDWVKAWLDSNDLGAALTASGTATFAPVLPLPYSMQWEYLEHLSEDYAGAINGLALYAVDVLPDLREYPNLLPLPRLSLDAPATPHQLLRQVSLGVDVFLLPFLNAISDAGIALSFAFPPPEPATIAATEGLRTLPLGIDMWSPEHKAAVAPLRDGCGCYACTAHHRAYLHHLLQAREMLGWTLLQIHNHAVLEAFFAGVRAALAEGEAVFETLRDRFGAVYEPELPEGTGSRPRARGYHFKSEGGDEKINKAPWGKLNGNGSNKDTADVVMPDTPVAP